MALLSDASVITASIDEPRHFGMLFDRHATVLFRYLVRRVGMDEAEGLLGELFRIAFERRSSFDCARSDARPWLYGIATNLVAGHRRREARRVNANVRLQATHEETADPAEVVAATVDARRLLPRVTDAIEQLPDEERDALVLYVWEELSYDEIARALDIPVGTVRSRLSRARHTLRELRDDPPEPTVFTRQKEHLMSQISDTRTGPDHVLRMPDVYARLAYEDEHAAVEFLGRVFGFEEIREARTENGPNLLAWLRIGDGVVMVGHANADIHRIHSPHTIGNTTVQMMVYVRDVDAHYAHAVEQGADITMPIEDAFYGERRYEATDPEGHRWHFAERFEDIKARGGSVSSA
jgi:RNA polymerase sigma-70 factor (ECF subfamily)